MEKNLNNEIVRVFLKPNMINYSPTLFSIFIIFAIIIIMYYRDINNNWDKYKCKPIIMMTAGLFNRDTDKNLQECLKHTQSEAVYNSVQNVQDEISEINSSISKLKTNRNSSISLLGFGSGNDIGSGIISQTDPLHNLSIAIQQNIMSVKNALSKIMGALVLSNYMTQGAITTTQTLNNSSVSQALSGIASSVPKANAMTSNVPVPKTMPTLNSAVVDIANGNYPS